MKTTMKKPGAAAKAVAKPTAGTSTKPARALAQAVKKPAAKAAPGATVKRTAASSQVQSNEWPLWEVFVRSRAGLDHKHCGSLHAADSAMALQMGREVYTRRQEGVSLWVVRSADIVASDPGDRDMLFDPMEDKVYRHPSFYKLPAEVDQM